MKLSSVLRYIERETGAVANIHILHPAFLDCEALRLEPDQSLHHGEFCRFNKMHGEVKSCIKNKEKSLKIAAKGRCFSGTCPFGVWDYVHPILIEEKLIAVLYLGGFPQKTPEPVPEAKRKELRRYADFLEQFIRIEIDLWSRTGGAKGTQRTPGYYVRNSMFFIDCNFSKDISVEDAAETLRVTPNYLGEQIKKHTGKSFRLILNERRIREAEVYLRLHKQFSISRVANLCGFNDSNYFATVFRKYTGKTPREYRNAGENTELPEQHSSMECPPTPPTGEISGENLTGSCPRSSLQSEAECCNE